jgi:SagB-type dehydrogenase family enzyme
MRIDFCCPEGNFSIHDASEHAMAAFRVLASNGSTTGALRERFLERGDLGGWLIFKSWLDSISGLIRRSVETDTVQLATLVPFSGRTRLASFSAVDEPFALSRFAYVRRIGARMALECPLGNAHVLFEDPRALAIAYKLAQPVTIEQLTTATGLDSEAVRLLISLLIDVRAVIGSERPDSTAEDIDPILASWEFHDLLFHARSRLGRRDLRYGGTYRHMGKFLAPPALRADIGNTALELPRPDLHQAMRVDPPFISVVEQRRSIRQFGDTPISADALSEFLYRVARVKRVFQADAATQELLFRAYPAGGAIHELEIYPVIARCEGIDTGIYRYDPARHALVRLADRNEHVDALLSMARFTLKQDCELQVLLVITARFQRVQWKYESMAYALILKNVGVLYQSMYLTATAMGLAPCALGGGDSDLFAMAAGLDYYAETSVGEFVLGTRGIEPAEIDAPYHGKMEPRC